MQLDPVAVGEKDEPPARRPINLGKSSHLVGSINQSSRPGAYRPAGAGSCGKVERVSELRKSLSAANLIERARRSGLGVWRWAQLEARPGLARGRGPELASPSRRAS